MRLMERSAHTARYGSSADLPPMRMPRNGGAVEYEPEFNPLRDSEWERRETAYDR
jgi:hypothetical protein